MTKIVKFTEDDADLIQKIKDYTTLLWSSFVFVSVANSVAVL